MEETASLLYATAVLTLVRRMYWGATYDLTHVLGPVGRLDILIVLGAVLSLSGGCYFYFSISYPHSVSWSWMAAVLGSLSALAGLITCRTDQFLQVLDL
ncbi:hypothetical protein C0Q70_01756 [Pomacea canaliculata]|uniref:Uncharacterized protein n=1 Tax=Pomacea canaliculata TaxID=400727 RepID=A0A2T7Q0D9_POMCA|nr:hypothetical protein C0Q70_01756 [Pomacea canaliculata]